MCDPFNGRISVSSSSALCTAITRLMGCVCERRSLKRDGLTVSSEAAALRSGRNPTSNRCRRKLWSSMPYTRSRNSTMGALWSGQKLADTSGSVTLPSDRQRHVCEIHQYHPITTSSPALTREENTGTDLAEGRSKNREREFGTFIDQGHFERDADDAHQVLGGNERAQDGTDPQSFAFTLIDELRDEIKIT